MALIVQLHEGVAVNKCPLNQSRLRIGRNPECDIFIDDAVVSSEHAVIERRENPDSKGAFEYFLEDQNSTNGTFLNDEKTTRQKLKHEDVIRVGWASFKFIDETKADPEKTAKIHKSWIPGVFYTKQ
ncbi:MAG: FHA domain-containing protein [Desulfobacterales bacterium]|jgi:pSer/pThr/pTyr-binding forkhead associated (FHA) protein